MKQQQFTKNERTVTVSSARDAVRLRYDGWVETPAQPEPESAEEPAPAKTTTPKKTSK